MMSPEPSLKLLRGGRSELLFNAVRVTVAPPEAPPFPVQAVVVEEDTWQVLAAVPDIREPSEPPLRIMTELLDSRALQPGTVAILGGTPFTLAAVVYDVGAEPICRPEWIAAAMTELGSIVTSRRITALALPLPGIRHGRLPLADAVDLLVSFLSREPLHTLRCIWLMVDKELRMEVHRMLAARENDERNRKRSPEIK